MAIVGRGAWCRKCGGSLDEKADDPPEAQKPCPECGSMDRHFEMLFEDGIQLSDAMQGVAEVHESGTRRWGDQWARVHRWRDRLDAYRVGGGLDYSIHASVVRDDFYAFFMNAYHLKDWLEKDPATSLTKADLQRAIAASTPLKLVADLCNASKHFELGSGGWSGQEPTLGSGKIMVSVGGDDHGIRMDSQCIELSDGTVLDAFGLADEILSAWRDALNGWGLSG